MDYKEMSFREMSAWIMSLALTVGMIFYFGLIVSVSLHIGELASPILPSIIFFTLILLTVAIVGHALAAIYVCNDALAPRDERDRRIATRAAMRPARFWAWVFYCPWQRISISSLETCCFTACSHG